jgi:hypothetical protein
MKSIMKSGLSFHTVVLGATVVLSLGSHAIAEAPKSSGPLTTPKPKAS